MLKTILCISVSVSTAYAQQAIPAAGNNATGSGGSASYTIGQCNYTTTTSNTGSSCQGVQHPFEIYTLTGIENSKNLNVNLLVFPNPTVDFLTLRIEGIISQKLHYIVIDNLGKIITQNILESKDTKITLGTCTSGTYFIQVLENTSIIKTFKVIKK